MIATNKSPETILKKIPEKSPEKVLEKSLEKIPEKVLEQRLSEKMLDQRFLLCWAAYFSTYLGRLNYAACLIAISAEKAMSKGHAGIISTMFFLCYGAGQLFSGMAGDRLRPQNMVFCGLMGGAACNLMFPFMENWQWMAVLWGMNGIFQSLIWSPIIRILAENYREPRRSKLCIAINTTVPAGTLAAYLLAVSAIRVSSWKISFYAGGIIMAFASVVWMLGMKNKQENGIPQRIKEAGVPKAEKEKKEKEGKEKEGKEKESKRIFLAAGVPMICLVLMVQGMLKDGVITWVPVYIGEVYSLSMEKAIIGTTFLPLLNLSGVYLAHQLNQKIFQNELVAAGALFGGTVISIGLMLLSLGMGPICSLVLLALSTTLMTGVNTLLASVVPVYFGRYQKSSSAAGILNSSVYAGCASSTYGIGVLAQTLGWKITMVVWEVAAVIGTLACAEAALRWKKFRLHGVGD